MNVKSAMVAMSSGDAKVLETLDSEIPGSILSVDISSSTDVPRGASSLVSYLEHGGPGGKGLLPCLTTGLESHDSARNH